MRDINALVALQTTSLQAKVENTRKLVHNDGKPMASAALLPVHERQEAVTQAKTPRCPRCGVLVFGLFPVAFLCETCIAEFREWDLARCPEEARAGFKWFSDLLGEVFKPMPVQR